MARVIVWNLVTLDGFFEGETKWDLQFHQSAWGDELAQMAKDFGDKAQMLVFGRITYEGMKSYWTTTDEEIETKTYMNALSKLVASHTLKDSDWNNTRVTADIEGELARLRAAPGKDIYMFGSAELANSMLHAGQIDEVMLGVAPVVLGKGNRFFKETPEALKLRLIEARSLKTGMVILRYSAENSR